MNDERIERGVRGALERDARPLPPTLRARLSAIPDEFPRERPPRRMARLFAPAGAIAAVLVLAAAALVLVGLHDSTVVPAASATPSAVAPAVVPPASSPAPSAPPSAPPLAPVTQSVLPVPPTPSPGLVSLGGFEWQRIDAQFGGAEPGPMAAVGSELVMATSPYAPVSPGAAMPHPTFWHSSDGARWQRLPDSPAFAGVQDGWIDVVLGLTSNGSGLIAVGMQQYADASSANAEAWTSGDGGTTWTRASVAGATGATMNLLYRVSGGFVAVGTDGYSFHAGMERGTAIWTSPDGTRWTRLPQSEVPSRASMSNVAHGGGRYVAVGQDLPPGAPSDGPVPVWTSTDGVHFTAVPRTPGAPAGGVVLRDVQWTGSAFAAVGDPLSLDAPTAWSSTDGIEWHQAVLPAAVPAGSQVRVEGLAQTPAGLLAVGALDDTIRGTTARGAAWESTDGRSWQEIAAPSAFEGVDLQSIQVVGGSHVFVGGRDDSGATPLLFLWILEPVNAGP